MSFRNFRVGNLLKREKGATASVGIIFILKKSQKNNSMYKH